MRSWIVQLRHHGKTHRITLGPVGPLPFEGPAATAPGAADLARPALNAARRGDDPKLAVGRAKQPQGIMLADVWEAMQGGLSAAERHRLQAREQRQGGRLPLEKPASALGHRPAAKIDTPEVQRWLDTIQGLGARSHALINSKPAAFRRLARLARNPRDRDHAAPVAAVQNFLKPGELKRLDAALLKLIARTAGPHPWLRGAAPAAAHRDAQGRGAQRSTGRTSIWITASSIWNATRRAARTWAATCCCPMRPARCCARCQGWRAAATCFSAGAAKATWSTLSISGTQALARAKLRHVRIHDLRHSYAASHVAAGTSLHVIGKLLGHRDPKTSARYAHLSREAAMEAVDRVAGTFGR